MNTLDHVFAEAQADRSLYLGLSLLLILTLTQWTVARAQRRTRSTVLLYVAHLALVPVAGYLRAQNAFAAQHGKPVTQTYEDVRLAVLVLAAMTAIGMGGQLLFDVLLPRVRLIAPRILRDLATGLAYVIAIFAIATKLGFNLSGIIATSAVVTAVIGFSLQDTLGNIMGGLALQLDNSVSVGDWIKVGDVAGRVTEIRWRYTAVETRNWETVVFPNSMLMKGQVVILGRRIGQPALWRRWIYFTVDATRSPSEVIERVVEAISLAPINRVAADPPPNCLLIDFNDSGCKYAVRYWLTDLATDDPTDSEVRQRIFFALKRMGAFLSLPGRHIFMHDASHDHTEAELSREDGHRLNVLGQLDVFRELGQAEQEHICKALKFAPFGRGETLTRQGNLAHWLYIVVTGEVSVGVTVESGLEREVSRLKGPTFVGEMGLLTGAPRTATIVAVTDVECYRLDKTAFHEILTQRPQLAQQVAELLTRRRVELEAVKEGLTSEAKEKRVRETSVEVLGKIMDFFGL